MGGRYYDFNSYLESFSHAQQMSSSRTLSSTCAPCGICIPWVRLRSRRTKKFAHEKKVFGSKTSFEHESDNSKHFWKKKFLTQKAEIFENSAKSQEKKISHEKFFFSKTIFFHESDNSKHFWENFFWPNFNF